MVSLYARYLDERTDDQIIEREGGYITYRQLNPSQMYAVDIYVLPEFREKGIARNLLDQVSEIAKSKGCKELFGTVASNKPWTTLNLKMMFTYGFEVSYSTNEAIVLKKEL